MISYEMLHDVLYEMLCCVDDICQAEKIPYMLGGGTLLGAVRNHDFIPWDDDIDLCIWKKDYPRFKSVLQKNLPSHLHFIEPADLFPSFYDYIPRIIDDRYLCHDPAEEDIFYGNKLNHLSIDIFIVENGANSSTGVRLLAIQQKMLYGLAMGHRFPDYKTHRGLIQKVQTTVLCSIGKRISINKISKWYEKICCRYENSEGKYCIIINDLPSFMGLPYERKWFIGILKLPFRHRLFPVQSGYHEKLTLQYGNYLIPVHNDQLFKKHISENQITSPL